MRFGTGDSGRAIYALDQTSGLIASGRLTLVVGQTFPLTDVAEAPRLGEAGHVRGKLVLLVE